MSLEICGRCRGEGQCIDERNGWGYCPECGGGGYVDEYYEDEWYEDDETEYYYGEPDIQFAPIHLHTAHPRLFQLEGARVDEWKPQPLFLSFLNGFKRGK